MAAVGASGGPGLAAAFTERSGSVATFDDHVGTGTVTDDSGEVWPFHCTRIADGSRSIPVGVAVTYRIEPGSNGLEAVAVARVPPG